ncbi:hypothetical protein V6N11_044630 [Hibiscus sabdariffa]|uniref:RNase H type-1 domain-containing protein n=1 Tax=Hibiscus sabdariffa TaxID=183260 RepID=A0ABR2NBX1_9ROSI
MVDINGNWNWRRFSSILPQGVLDRVLLVLFMVCLIHVGRSFSWSPVGCNGNIIAALLWTLIMLSRVIFLSCSVRLTREYVAEFNKSHVAVSRTSEETSHWRNPPLVRIKANSDDAVRGFRQVQLETDNLDVARILQGSSDALVGCSLVDAILMILARQWTVFVRHITRDQNLVADRVVALCWDPSIGSRDFDLVPDALNDLVRKEVEAG